LKNSKAVARRIVFGATRLIMLWLFSATTAEAQAATNLLVPRGAVWKYLDDGSDQGAAWRSPAFNDGTWASGGAQLGYGESDEQTELSYGTNAANKHITYYFRHAFQVVGGVSNYSLVTLRLLRDDGAVVYLNGTNVFRSNMPTGSINHRTLASANVGGTAETTFFPTNLPGGVLQDGTNVVAVEVHQFSTNSPDLSFDLELVGLSTPPPTNIPPAVTRGPYLQQGTPTSLIVRWHTDVSTDSRVWFGANSSLLDRQASDSTSTNQHEVLLAGLAPDTKYFYAIGADAGRLAGDESYYFTTAPTNARPARIWVIGDSGTGDQRPRSVYQAYTNFTGARDTDVWLMLGDNAYNTGTDAQYQAAVFEMYPELLRKTVVWPTIGNHDTAFDPTPAPTIPYFRIFSLPANGEAGGVPSGTEKYYSYDHGNIHFVCLDAMSSDRSSDGPMCVWLQQDLAANDKEWLIAYWHHPPYTKGSHDSDTELELIEMRENVAPILEAHGVDLVLCGHSHCYERSYLINGHYGYSATFDEAMKVQSGNGREGETGAYIKPPANTGTIYVVAGSSGQATFVQDDWPHAAMCHSELELGSLVLDIDGPVLRAKFLRETGAINDYFTIVKDSVEALHIVSFARYDDTLTLMWTSRPGKRYLVERATELSTPNWTAASDPIQAGTERLEWSVQIAPGQAHAFYRVVSLTD